MDISNIDTAVPFIDPPVDVLSPDGETWAVRGRKC